jgi:hypothetical protein
LVSARPSALLRRGPVAGGALPDVLGPSHGLIMFGPFPAPLLFEEPLLRGSLRETVLTVPVPRVFELTAQEIFIIRHD